MRDMRIQFSDRRHNNVELRLPFKDSAGATIRECRRRIPDRRLYATYKPSGLIRLWIS